MEEQEDNGLSIETRFALFKRDIKEIKESVTRMEKQLEKAIDTIEEGYVTKGTYVVLENEVSLLKKIVYGVAGTTFTWILIQILSSTLNKTP